MHFLTSVLLCMSMVVFVGSKSAVCVVTGWCRWGVVLSDGVVDRLMC